MLDEKLIQSLKEAKINYNECFSKKLIGYKVDNNIFVVPNESYVKDDIVLNKAEKVNVYIPNILLSNIADDIIKIRNEKVDFSGLTKKFDTNK